MPMDGMKIALQRYWKNIVSEFLGTIIYLYIGLASSVSAPTVINVALGFGFASTGAVQALGHISGCHINPAVTLAFLINKECTIFQAIYYVAAQLAGAVSGVLLLQFCLPRLDTPLGITDIHTNINCIQGLVFEIILTMQLTTVVLAVWDFGIEFKISPAVAIGLTIGACNMAGYNFTGASMNPARSFGPALVHGHWKHHWIYWIGPLLGSSVATYVYQFLIKKDEPDGNIDF